MPCIHRNCARQKTGFAERSGQKIVLQRQLPDFGVEFLHVDWRRRVRLALAKKPGSSFEKLIPSGLDDIRMDIELCRQFGSVFSPFTAASATFALNAGLWFRRGRLVMVSPVPGIMPISGRISTYPRCPDSPSQL